MPYNLKSQLIKEFSHGFFLRRGGSSEGEFESLNCDLKSSDHESKVLENRALVAKTLEIESRNLITLKQVHSSKVINIERPVPSNSIEGDAMVTSKEGICLGILTADCAPILLAENKNRIVGIIHAGWRGALDSVLENTVRAMTELGAEKEQIAAVIGPCIQRENYEVGPEFLDRFLSKDPKYRKHFTIDNNMQIWFDLPALILERLTVIGIKTTENLAKCTFALSNDFFSHRRNQKNNLGDCGRMISTIKI
ncbi:MAG: peptidoglycan editing factor PgeF [Rhodobacteraceae bacterium]|nr:MAG: peptidoglycan editing factor PgeF [Paracoccaceae bacterium]